MAVVEELLAWQSLLRLTAVAEKSRERGFAVEVLESKDAAAARILTLAADAQSIGFGGSLTVAALNVIEALRAQGKELLIHGNPALSKEEKLAVMRRQLTCDLFLASVNALASDGTIVNIDGNGNRVAAMTFGPKQTVLVVGHNKLVEGGVYEALKRIATVAAPVNAHRLGCKTPCAVTGRCADCAGRNPGSICRITSVIRQCPSCSNIRILLVNDDLGL